MIFAPFNFLCFNHCSIFDIQIGSMIGYCFSTRVGDPSTGLMEIGTTSDVSSEQGLRNIASLNHDIAYFPFKFEISIECA